MRNAYFEEACDALRPAGTDLDYESDTRLAGWFPVDLRVPMAEAVLDGRVTIRFRDEYRDCGAHDCAAMTVTDTAAEGQEAHG